MSLVIYLIGQLNCHVICCKTRKRWLVRFDPSIVSLTEFWLVYFRQIVSSVFYFVCFHVTDQSGLYGAGGYWHQFSGDYSKLVDQLSSSW